MLLSELFQIYINGKQLNVVDDTLRLIHGTEANLSCIYRNATYGGKWKVGQGQVQSISPEWIAGFYGTYHRNPIFTKSVQLNHAGDISCIAMGHRRNLTVNVLCKMF